MTQGAVLVTCEQVKAAVNKQFVPVDYAKRSWDRLRKLNQLNSVSKYLDDFRNFVLAIPGMNEVEKLDRFVECLN